MIQLDRPSFTYEGHTFHVNTAYREFNKSVVTINSFVVYKPKNQILPLVTNECDRTYFTHWDNLKPIPLGQIELFVIDDADPDEPPEPPELNDDHLSATNAADKKLNNRLIESDIQGFWRTSHGYHPVNPKIGTLASYVVRCDILPISEQIRMCQQRIRQQRSRIRDLKVKKQSICEITNSLSIICEEKQRICKLLDPRIGYVCID